MKEKTSKCIYNVIIILLIISALIIAVSYEGISLSLFNLMIGNPYSNSQLPVYKGNGIFSCFIFIPALMYLFNIFCEKETRKILMIYTSAVGLAAYAGFLILVKERIPVDQLSIGPGIMFGIACYIAAFFIGFVNGEEEYGPLVAEQEEPVDENTEENPGNEAETTKTAAYNIRKVCPECGAYMPTDSKYCGLCGYSFENNIKIIKEETEEDILEESREIYEGEKEENKEGAPENTLTKEISEENLNADLDNEDLDAEYEEEKNEEAAEDNAEPENADDASEEQNEGNIIITEEI